MSILAPLQKLTQLTATIFTFGRVAMACSSAASSGTSFTHGRRTSVAPVRSARLIHGNAFAGNSRSTVRISSPACRGIENAARFNPCEVLVVRAISPTLAPISRATSSRERCSVAKKCSARNVCGMWRNVTYAATASAHDLG